MEAAIDAVAVTEAAAATALKMVAALLLVSGELPLATWARYEESEPASVRLLVGCSETLPEAGTLRASAH